MPFSEVKVYSDGLHYIGIPHTTRPSKKTTKVEEKVLVKEDDLLQSNNEDKKPPEIKEERYATRKELFNEYYEESKDLKKNQQRSYISKKMGCYFENSEDKKLFIENNFERKNRNRTVRYVRLWRKVNLQPFNYFCTFTYDDTKHTEESFKKQLRTCFRNFVYRKGWRYIGVWERSPENKRLHFHGLFYIPKGTLVNNILVKDFDIKSKRMQVTYQNPYFNERFGRSDFKDIACKDEAKKMINYILKYIEKSGEKIVYSKGLPQFFISDIEDDDVACRIGIDDRKLLLFDDFKCWNEGEYVGKVSPETISKLRKVN